ncbi:hypothetical protein [Streptomyces sp. NPDC127033]|uniref:hypothetical protein n=1 Tax=Streptomyces sp. NPDC127033 TaxID=3347110 RepID=UPI003663F69E
MEQRIDPKIQTEFAAGTDPAYIPGLVAPAPPKPAGKEPGRAEDETEEPAAADEAAAPATAEKGEEQPQAEQRPDEHDERGAAGERDAPGERDEDDERDPAAEKEPAEDRSEDGTEDGARAGLEDGPVFEVSDRRGSITADREGVRFRLDDQEAEFDWDEIGAVEVKTPRFGRRFTVTVHISARRWFDAEVEAPSKNLLKQWEAELDEVLDAYFEES